MYGSGSLRQTGSAPILIGTTIAPDRSKDKQESKNNLLEHEEKPSADNGRPRNGIYSKV